MLHDLCIEVATRLLIDNMIFLWIVHQGLAARLLEVDNLSTLAPLGAMNAVEILFGEFLLAFANVGIGASSCRHCLARQSVCSRLSPALLVWILLDDVDF